MGIAPPVTAETSSFKAVLTGRVSTIRDVLYGAYTGGPKPGIRAVRQGDWKLIKYAGDRPDSLHTQLFNLAANPHELLPAHHDPTVIAITGYTPGKLETNLADLPRLAAKRRQMEALLRQEMTKYDDPYHFSDPVPSMASTALGSR